MTIDDLETPCHKCKGTGSYNYGRCGLCCGTGYMPTEVGEKILDLMRHHFRHLLRDTADE